MAVKAVVIGLCAALAVAAPARDLFCGDRAKVLRDAEAESQRRLWYGIVEPWLGIIEVLVGDDGAWTILVTRVDGVVCLKGTGTDSTLEPAPEDGPEA